MGHLLLNLFCLVACASALYLKSTLQLTPSLYSISSILFMNQSVVAYTASNNVDHDQPLALYFLSNGTQYPVPKAPQEEVSAIFASSINHAVYFGDSNSTISRFSLINQKLTPTHAMDPPHTRVLGIVSIQGKDDMIYSVGSSGKICKQKLLSTADPVCLLAHAFNSSLIYYMPDSSVLVTTGGDRTFRIWSTDLSLLHTVYPLGQQSMITAFAHSHNHFITGDQLGICKIFTYEGHMSSISEKLTIPNHGANGKVQCLMASQKWDSLIVLHSNGALMVYSLSSGKLSSSYSTGNHVQSCSLLDYSLITGHSGGIARLWQI